MIETAHTVLLHVQGMHCRACVVLIESSALELDGVTSARVEYARKTLELRGVYDTTTEQIVAKLNTALAPHGYRVSSAPLPQEDTSNWRELFIAVPLASVVLLLLWLLHTLGLVDAVRIDTVTYGTAFIIGVVASLSTCVAVVGGLVLSLSATFAKDGKNVRPMILFHGARLATFFLLGGALGALGSTFAVSPTLISLLGLSAGLIMLFLGIRLTGLLSQVRMPQLPAFALRRIPRFSSGGSMTPFAAGAVTFFLPCGFTQSMQFYALSVGGFWEGALTLLMFALGTLPVLAALSFGAYRVRLHAWSGVFFKTIGLLVSVFAGSTIIGTLTAL